MTNCAINWFELTGPEESLRAAARHLSLPPPAKQTQPFDFDLPGWHDDCAWHVAENLAAHFVDLAIRYEYRPEFDNFALHGVGAWEGGSELYRAPLEIADSCCYVVPGEQEGAYVFPLIRRTEAVARAAAHFPLDRHLERIARIPAGLSGWRTLDSDPPYAYSAIRLDDTGTGGEVLVLSPFLARATLFEDVDSVGAFGRERVLQFGKLHAFQDDLPNWISAG